MNFPKLLISFFFFTFIFGCSEKTTYSGKILNQEDLSNINIKNKNELLNKFGKPSYIDYNEDKYFYYTEKNKSKNFYSKKTEYSYLFIFEINEKDEIISTKSINLLTDSLDIYEKKETENNIVERGLLEKIFGGVGPNPNQLPNSQ
ncbi:MAG: hypothetical protein CMP16_03315 [Rickettsiales bacterium]|nr:hypothetical protein [Rickettsiales bacterium]|tara:strand:+ start:48 stop:485 length:438 start_codon:yes stop_codon:yes gene_type:complete